MRVTGWLFVVVVWSVAGCAARSGPTVGTVTSFDGVEIAYEARGAGSPALVFVHGWSCNRGFWSEQLPVFASAHRVIALDLAGHGASGGGRSDWTMASLARDVEAVITQLDARDVILVGHSLGGPVSLLAAARMPERVGGVIAVDTLHDAEFRVTEEHVAPMVSAFERDFEGTMSRFVSNAFSRGTPEDDPMMARVREEALRTNPQVAIGIMRSYVGYSPSDALRACPCPVRAINAAMQPTRIDANRRYCPQFDAVIVPNAGHFLMLERPEEFNAALVGQIDEILSAGGVGRS